MSPSLDRWTPTLVGGAVGGGLSVLPPFCVLSCCCCCNSLYFLVGGIVAGVMLARAAARAGVGVPAEQGLLVGLGAGLVGALMAGIVFGSFEVVAQLSGWQPQMNLDALRDVPPELRRWLEWIEELAEQQRQRQASVLLTLLFSFAQYIIPGLALGALGGLIGVLLGRRPPTDDRGGYAASPGAGAGPAGGAPPAAPGAPPALGPDGGWSVSSSGSSQATPAPPAQQEGSEGPPVHEPSPPPERRPSPHGSGTSAWDKARHELEESEERNEREPRRREPSDGDREGGADPEADRR